MGAESSYDLSPAAACVAEALESVGVLEGRALDTALRDAEVLARQALALRSAVIGRAVETNRFKADGHRRAGAWVATLTRAGRAEAAATARVAKALASMPRLRAALEAGAVPFDVVEIITRRFNDDRVVERLIADDELLTSFVEGRSTDEVRQAMTGWDQMTNPAGAADAAAKAHDRRRVRIVRKDGEVYFYARFGAAQGEEVAAVHERFAKREFERDAAVAVDGELARNAGQRSADAFAEAMATADKWFTHKDRSCSGCGTSVPHPTGTREPLTNIVFDVETFQRWATGDEPEGPIDDDRLRRFVSGTSDGHPIPADDIVRRMIMGRVRIVVRRADGVITSVGRAQRLFRGRTRDAVVLQKDACTWGVCGVPASQCEADHLHPHSEGGETSSENGGPGCDHHNRLKAKYGYRIVRDARGIWHVLRPDGTSISGDPPPQQRAGPDAS